jgi:hypothetical protein
MELRMSRPSSYVRVVLKGRNLQAEKVEISDPTTTLSAEYSADNCRTTCRTTTTKANLPTKTKVVYSNFWFRFCARAHFFLCKYCPGKIYQTVPTAR